ncbi:hypothetical protein HB943_02020 [Listeria weihenstephanensis]|uniref:LXG domain-containing protein n=1 Tax=Listeria weihenstephanensis TaxID=1006155 RepID=A0A841Z4N9_9LIST|nr:hypothetical protein [Listeria weihenstephanensis]MBC1499363.1 hypothetical protein [Listeria weihenstephanensis]
MNKLFDDIESASKKLYEDGQESIVKATRKRVEHAMKELQYAVEDLTTYQQDLDMKNAPHPPLLHKYREQEALESLQQK